MLRKPLFVRFCFLVWVLFGILPKLCITSFGDCTHPQNQETTKAITPYEFFFQSKKERSGVAFTNTQHKKKNKMIPCIPYLHTFNAKLVKQPKILKDENNSTSLLKQHANIVSLNKARLHGLSLHCYKRCHLVENLRCHIHRACIFTPISHHDGNLEHLCSDLRKRIPALAGLIVGTEMVEW